MAPENVVLITGCSSGIGAALATEFHERGHRVYATARRLESLEFLAARGVRTLTLDVTDGDSIAAAAAVLAKETGRLDILVNNAGYNQIGAVVDLSAVELRRQFDTNVIAPAQVTRAFLPLMLSQKRGRILNVGSISGILTTPFAGAYCASKAALHALSDAMRMELAPFGIAVITIQPGSVTSNIGDTATTNAAIPDGSIFAPLAGQVRRRAQISQQGGMPARDFARRVITAALADPAPALVRAGTHSFRLPLLQRWLPTRVLDRRLKTMFGLDRI